MQMKTSYIGGKRGLDSIDFGDQSVELVLKLLDFLFRCTLFI